MKQKLTITTFIYLISLASFAIGGDMGGGRHIVIPTSQIEAFISEDGTYTSIDDLHDGYEKLDGLQITPVKTILDRSIKTKDKIESVIFRNGSEVKVDRIQKLNGGDMGGG